MSAPMTEGRRAPITDCLGLGRAYMTNAMLNQEGALEIGECQKPTGHSSLRGRLRVPKGDGPVPS